MLRVHRGQRNAVQTRRPQHPIILVDAVGMGNGQPVGNPVEDERDSGLKPNTIPL
jgi:hypothetical protein